MTIQQLFAKSPLLFTAGKTFTDVELCSAFNITVPTSFSADRAAATATLVNFQTKKGYLVASINKLLASSKLQLSQTSHTSYVVIPSSVKKARLKAQVSRLQATIKGL